MLPRAEQETDYVNHVFMQQNPGFLVLYSFIKDALLSKVGIVKVWWETREEHERETYHDLDDAAFAIIVADPEVEVVAHTERRVANGDTASEPASEDRRLPRPIAHRPLSAIRSCTTSRCEPRAPINARGSRACRRRSSASPATPARIRDADYCFHDVLRSEAKLIAQGYDREQVRRLPSHGVADTIEAQARDTVERGDAEARR